MTVLDTFDDLILNELLKLRIISNKSEFVRSAVKRQLLLWDKARYISLREIVKDIENKVV